MQRIINILVIILVGFSLYSGIIVDSRRVQTMDRLETSDEELQGHKRMIDEEYHRLSLKFEGRGKHMRRMQDDIAGLRRDLQDAARELGNRIDETNYLLEQAEERLSEDISDLRSELRTVSDDLSTYKRRTNREILDIKEILTRLEEDLKALDEQVNPPEDEGRSRN
jgi:chromosome segregation ATPase